MSLFRRKHRRSTSVNSGIFDAGDDNNMVTPVTTLTPTESGDQQPIGRRLGRRLRRPLSFIGTNNSNTTTNNASSSIDKILEEETVTSYYQRPRAMSTYVPRLNLLTTKTSCTSLLTELEDETNFLHSGADDAYSYNNNMEKTSMGSLTHSSTTTYADVDSISTKNTTSNDDTQFSHGVIWVGREDDDADYYYDDDKINSFLTPFDEYDDFLTDRIRTIWVQ